MIEFFSVGSRLKKIGRGRIVSFLLIIIVASLSVVKTASLYFWHDDFSIVYIGRTGHCVFTWPYHSYCTIFSFLEKIFNYSASRYFGFAFLLFIFSIFVFYFLVSRLYSRKTSVLLALIYATGYVGAGVFLEIYDSVTTFLSLGLFFLSLGIQISEYKSKRGFNLWSLLLYLASVLVLQARSQTYLFPYLAVVLFFAPRHQKIKTLGLVVVLHIAVCLAAYLGSPPINIVDTSLSRSLFGLNPIIEFKEFFQTLSYVYLAENFKLFILLKMSDPQIMTIRFVIGLVVSISLSIFLFKRLTTQERKTFFLALSWIIFIYLPFGIRSDLAIWTTHRYLIYVFPGIIMIWGLLSKYRLWKWLTLIIVAFSVYKVNIFLDPYVTSSRQRQNFYSQFGSLAGELPKGAVVFFDSPPKLVSKLGDYFRVGFLPSEAAVATEKAMAYTDIKIFVDSKDLSRYITENSVDIDKFFSYFYDGESLFDTTTLSRNLLKGDGDQMIFSGVRLLTTQLVIKPDGLYQGKNGELVFGVDEHKLILPSELEFRMVSQVPRLILPYDQGCQKNADGNSTSEILDFLSQSGNIMDQIKLVSTEKPENSLFINNLVDGEIDTYWQPGSRSWVNKERPKIRFDFAQPIQTRGLIVQSTVEARSPADFEFANGDEIFSYHKILISDAETAFIFDKIMNTDSVEFKILRTPGGNRPMINDLRFIAPNYKKDYLAKVDLYQQCPAANIRTSEDLAALTKYLSQGAQACVKWDSKIYGEGKVNFKIFVDNNEHVYRIPLPAIGINPVNLKIGCFDYPISLKLNSVRLIH